MDEGVLQRTGSPRSPAGGHRSPERLRVEVVDSVSALAPYLPEWDALAVGTAQPFGAPGLLLPWWRHMRLPDDRLNVGLVLDRDTLVGVAPLFVRRRWGRRLLVPLGAGACFGVGPLANAADVPRVASALGETLGAPTATRGRGRRGRPGRPPGDLVRFAGMPAGSPWLSALPGQFVEHKRGTALEIVLEPGEGRWLATRTSRFRRQLRNNSRQFEATGGRVTSTTGAARDQALRELADLYVRRWQDRGGSRTASPGLRPWLSEAAGELGPDRLRVVVATVDGRVVAGAALVAAGGEVGAWLTAFDPACGGHAPGILLNAEVVRYAETCADRRVDLGPGVQEYKRRFATGEQTLVWTDLLTTPHPAVAASVRAEAAGRASAVRTRSRLRQARHVAASRWPVLLRTPSRVTASRAGSRPGMTDA